MIMKATSDDDTPIPGYLYKEISDISWESRESCESLLEFLTDRLNKTSYHTKYKVLKLMKYIIENGSELFRQELRHQSVTISEATKFGGPPDPLHGEVPYKMVRKTAKEVLDVLFDTENNRQQKSRSQEKAPPGIGASNKSGGMVGFGTVQPEKPKTLGDSILKGIEKIADQIREPPPDPRRDILQLLESTSKNTNPIQLHEISRLESPQSSLPQKNLAKQTHLMEDKPKKHIPGKVGGGWEDSDEEIDNAPGSSFGGSEHRELADRLETCDVEDWTAETDLIDSTIQQCSSQLLTRKEIQGFIGRCSDVNCDKIIELLNERLKIMDSDHQIKYLLLLECFLRTDLCNYDHIALSTKENLVKIYNEKQNGVKSKARKIIRILEKLSSFRDILPLADQEVPPLSSGKLTTETDPQSDGSPP